MAEVVLTTENFETEVMNPDIPVLVDFWATWCGPCKMLAPVLEEFANENEGVVKVGKVNVDDSPNLATKYGIASIPTLIVFKNGQPVKTSVGFCTKEKLEELIK